MRIVRAEWQARGGELRAALATLNEVLALVEERDMAAPDAFWFRYAQAARLANEYAQAVESATRYLTSARRHGEHYRAGLELLESSAREVQALREREEAAECAERAERERRQAEARAKSGYRGPRDIGAASPGVPGRSSRKRCSRADAGTEAMENAAGSGPSRGRRTWNWLGRRVYREWWCSVRKGNHQVLKQQGNLVVIRQLCGMPALVDRAGYRLTFEDLQLNAALVTYLNLQPSLCGVVELPRRGCQACETVPTVDEAQIIGLAGAVTSIAQSDSPAQKSVGELPDVMGKVGVIEGQGLNGRNGVIAVNDRQSHFYVSSSTPAILSS